MKKDLKTIDAREAELLKELASLETEREAILLAGSRDLREARVQAKTTHQEHCRQLTDLRQANRLPLSSDGSIAGAAQAALNGTRRKIASTLARSMEQHRTAAAAHLQATEAAANLDARLYVHRPGVMDSLPEVAALVRAVTGDLSPEQKRLAALRQQRREREAALRAAQQAKQATIPAADEVLRAAGYYEHGERSPKLTWLRRTNPALKALAKAQERVDVAQAALDQVNAEIDAEQRQQAAALAARRQAEIAALETAEGQYQQALGTVQQLERRLKRDMMRCRREAAARKYQPQPADPGWEELTITERRELRAQEASHA
jgi:hypothetical protein